MKISYNWLKRFLNEIPEPEELSTILTSTGLEVEGITAVESVKGGLRGVVVGQVIEKCKHPGADKLNLTKVDLGEGQVVQIVCGAPNVNAGQKVLVATVGSTIYPKGQQEGFTLKKAKIRGEESHGMICAEDELGLGDSHDGIMVLAQDAPIGMKAGEYLNVTSDHLIEIGLTPNRTDAISHYGVARDVLAWLKVHSRAPMDAALILDKPAGVASGDSPVFVSVQDHQRCVRYAGAYIDGVQVQESPSWLRNLLLIIGLRPINNVVDVTNFILHGLGQPLHAFDGNVVNGNVVVRTASKGEKLVTLDLEERELSEEDLMICNQDGPMCIAGVFGGAHSGVSESTTSVFLESALFDSVSVRKTARRHQLNTDASYRFERGLDPEMVLPALQIAVQLICDLTGGKVSGGYSDQYPDPLTRQQISIDTKKLNSFCGTSIPHQQIADILRVMDFQVNEMGGSELSLQAPLYRTDVSEFHDVAEEVLRIYGYDHIPLTGRISFSMINKPKDLTEQLKETVAAMLSARGYHEAMNNSLTRSEYSGFNRTLFPEDQVVALINPLSVELGVMRSSLLFGLIENAVWNRNRRNEFLRLYEFGKVYRKEGERYREERKLGILLGGERYPESWNNPNEVVGIPQLLGTTESVLMQAGLDVHVQPAEHALFEAAVAVQCNGKTIGTGGRIAHDLLKFFQTDDPLFAIELDWDHILNLSSKQQTAVRDIPRFPAVRRDLSLLLNEEVNFSELQELVTRQGGKLIKKISLFDVYEGKNVDKGKKSYAISLLLQDEESTLTDKQVDKVMNKVIIALENEIGATLRS